ncbi:hypothetical protein B0T09DRAFT_376962 [Sordaria sp. MPI-SDFR-AT-0083]|nr:hypothetical protein B0T09DRAFT_376962 [Sordaria sp. MPI-SDFR-AT-0083]
MSDIRECNVPEALFIPVQHQTIIRPILLKTYYVKGKLNDFRFKRRQMVGFKFAKGKLVTSKLEWDEERPEHYTAVARYLFTPKENGQKKKTCTECMNPEKYGPFAECVVVAAGNPRDGEHQDGAFKGDPKKARYSGSRVLFSRETIHEIPTDMLLKAREVLVAEIARRRANMEQQ